MAKYYGSYPDVALCKMVDVFENSMLIRLNNRQLVSTVYVDVQEREWSVAFAYNYSHAPGIHGHENQLEVRYYTNPHGAGSIRMFRSDEECERTLMYDLCQDPSVFIRFVLDYERTLLSGSA